MSLDTGRGDSIMVDDVDVRYVSYQQQQQPVQSRPPNEVFVPPMGSHPQLPDVNFNIGVVGPSEMERKREQILVGRDSLRDDAVVDTQERHQRSVRIKRKRRNSMVRRARALPRFDSMDPTPPARRPGVEQRSITIDYTAKKSLIHNFFKSKELPTVVNLSKVLAIIISIKKNNEVQDAFESIPKECFLALFGLINHKHLYKQAIKIISTLGKKKCDTEMGSVLATDQNLGNFLTFMVSIREDPECLMDCLDILYNNQISMPCIAKDLSENKWQKYSKFLYTACSHYLSAGKPHSLVEATRTKFRRLIVANCMHLSMFMNFVDWRLVFCNPKANMMSFVYNPESEITEALFVFLGVCIRRWGDHCDPKSMYYPTENLGPLIASGMNYAGRQENVQFRAITVLFNLSKLDMDKNKPFQMSIICNKNMLMMIDKLMSDSMFLRDTDCTNRLITSIVNMCMVPEIARSIHRVLYNAQKGSYIINLLVGSYKRSMHGPTRRSCAFALCVILKSVDPPPLFTEYISNDIADCWVWVLVNITDQDKDPDVLAEILDTLTYTFRLFVNPKCANIFFGANMTQKPKIHDPVARHIKSNYPKVRHKAGRCIGEMKKFVQKVIELQKNTF